MLTAEDLPDSSSPPVDPGCGTFGQRSKGSSPTEHDPAQDETPLGAAKRVKVSRKPAGKKPWQSPSQEDFSRESRYRIRLSKSAHSSPSKTAAAQKRDSKPNLTKGTLHLPRLRSKSLGRLDCVREGPGAEASMIFSTSKHAAQTVGVAAGRKFNVTPLGRVDLPPRSRNGTPYTILSPAIEQTFWSDSSAQSSPCRKRSAQDTFDGISLHGGQGIDTLIHCGLHFDNDGTPQSLKAESQLIPWELTDSSWIPRGTSTSPFASRNAQPHGNTTEEPFWTRFEGKLYVCFPSNLEDTVYRIEIYAKIDLSAPDAEGWFSFSIPGLPRLEASQASGRLIFFHDQGQEISIDKGLLDFFDDAEAHLVLGGSHFEGSPLLRLRPLLCQSHDIHDGALAEDYRTSFDDAVKTNEAEVGTQQGDILSRWTDEQIRLGPIHFLGLTSRDDPLELEDPTKLIWNLHVRIDRIITGELECQMNLKVDISSVPSLVIDARDWVPNCSIIDGRLATHGEWRETEDGDMALQSVASTRPRNVTNVDVYWKEFGIVDELTGREATTTRESRLPNIVGKIVLNGSLTCNIDNAIIVLTDIYGEEITWRADSMIGCNVIRLPKLYPGYRMHMKVNEVNPSLSDDLASLSDVDVRVESELPTSCEKISATEVVDQRVLDITVPKLLVQRVPAQDPTIWSHTTATVPPAQPSTFRHILKYCVLAFILLHILEQIPTVSTPIDYCSDLKITQQKEIKPEYEDFLNDPIFGLNMWSSMADDLENAHMVSLEEGQLGSESGERDQIVAVTPADEEQTTERDMGWRDRIDHALGWRELGS